MKPRFSILSLLNITAYAATVAAAIAYPDSIWWMVNLGLLLVIMMWWLAEAIDGRGVQSVFAGWLIASALIYFLVAAFDGSSFGDSRRTSGPRLPLPHRLLEQLGEPVATIGGPKAHPVVEGIAMANTSLACGLLGGSFFAWRYRVRERQLNSDL
jgi:hypothetical protein